jgi:glucosamine-6-phosphate deaminase
MEVIIQNDADAASALAARRIAQVVREKPNAVLGLATGSTPLRLYKELIRLHREEGLDFSQVTSFNLDEYLGLAPEHPASYRYFMRENLFQHINIVPERTHVPSGQVAGPDIAKYCEGYEAQIREAGGLDLQVLGIGSDGHIGFNEPSSSLASRTRIKTLTQRTREDNTPFFDNPEDVPHHVITMGVGTIMEAREIHLLAFGDKKADAIAAAVEGPITANVPASVLQMHRTVRVFTDEGAAEKLTRREYFRWVFDNKPAWQAF